MKTSIEDIWQQGFMASDALIAPKVNNLYTQKSKHIIDKLTATFKWNLWGLIIGGLVILVAFSFFAIPYLGAFICATTCVLAHQGQQQLKLLSSLDKNVSSLEYLTAFDTWLKGMIIHYTKLHQCLYPALFVASMIQLGVTNVGTKAIQGFIVEYPDIPQLFGIPIAIFLLVIIFAGLLSYFAGPLYRLDLKTVYGRQFDKLEDVLKDMTELSTVK